MFIAFGSRNTTTNSCGYVYMCQLKVFYVVIHISVEVVVMIYKSDFIIKLIFKIKATKTIFFTPMTLIFCDFCFPFQANAKGVMPTSVVSVNGNGKVC